MNNAITFASVIVIKFLLTKRLFQPGFNYARYLDDYYNDILPFQPRFSYGRYLDNYYNYFLPAYYSNFGYGKRSVDHNQQPTANAAN